jgi:hypothetical protein
MDREVVRRWDLPTPFVLELDVQHDDIDTLGHANHSACVELSTGKSKRMPDEFAEGFSRALILAPTQ